MTPKQPYRAVTGPGTNPGSFASPPDPGPGMSLVENFTGPDGEFDMHAYYDAEADSTFETFTADAGLTGAESTAEQEALFADWLEEQRTPEVIDAYFAQLEPEFATAGPTAADPRAWGNEETPF